MFIALQIPVTDVRPFIESETHRLNTPVWSVPRLNRDFVRGFGVVRQRKMGGVDDWNGEGIYCEAENSVRFENSLKPVIIDTTPIAQYRAFRRLFVNCPISSAYSISRLEIGFGFKLPSKPARKKTPKLLPLKGMDCLNLIKTILSETVKIKSDNQFQALKLIEADRKFARAYLEATTNQVDKKLPEIQNWWCEAGAPLLIFEYVIGREISELPQYVRYVQSQLLTELGIQLSYMQVELNGKVFPVWFLGTPYSGKRVPKRPEFFSGDDEWLYPRQRNLVRQLRINLMRFHAERENIKQIFRLVVEKKIEIKRGTVSSDLLQEFLLKSINLLSREEREGIPQKKISDVVNFADRLVNKSDRAALLELLSGIRKTIFHNIKTLIDKSDVFIAEPVYNLQDNKAINIFQIKVENSILEGGATMPINIMQGNTITGDVNQVAANNITNSFNKVRESDASDELKSRLEELNKAVAEMCKSLPEEKQKEVTKDLQVLTDEAVSKTPRKKWYELSAEGLIDAAKAVGEVAGPVITTAKAVLALLG